MPTGVAPGDGDAGAVDAALDDAGPDAPGVDASDGGDPDGLPTTSRMLTDDSAADFGQGTPRFEETRVERSGGVAPRAYYVGGLCAAGSDELLFTDGATATGAMLPVAPSQLGLARGVELELADNAIPPGVGITNGNDWTLWWTGELFLPAGQHTLALRADDHGFLELRAPGATDYTKLLGVNFTDGERSATYEASAGGWYGFRVAVAQRGGGVELDAKLDGQTIPRRLTRCRVDEVRGLAETGFDQSQFLDVAATTIEQGASAANIDWTIGSPADLGLTGNDTFSVRWAGQFYLDVAGIYRLRVRSDDGYRLWVDGTRLRADTSNGIYDVTTDNLTLSRGWHDVVLDTTEDILAAKSQLSVASGPELAGQAFPPERLRPAEGRFERFESMTAPGIATPGPAIFGFGSPVSATITGIDVGYVLNVDNGFPSVTTTLSSGSTTAILRTSSSGDTTDRFHPIAFDNLTFAPTWSLTAQLGSGGGSLAESWLTVHYRDATGTGPTPVVARFESSVRDLLGSGGREVASIDRATLTTRAAAGATVTIAVRTCEVPAECATQPYTTDLAAAPPRRYLQYRLDFATDGDHEPAVERVQLDYATR